MLIKIIIIFLLGFAKFTCLHSIYCNSTILGILNSPKLFNDSKTFVDMPIKTSPEQIHQEIQYISHDVVSLKQFITKHFDTNFNIREHTPDDWVETPNFLKNIKNQNLKELGNHIHILWKTLIRKFENEKYCTDCYSSIHTIKYPFVVPGGRFR
jgi:alpha,alpha-trehalase